MSRHENISEWSQDEFRKFVEDYGMIFLAFARRYTGETASAEDIVQDCLCRLWVEKKRHRDVAITNAPAFAIATIRNMSLNYMRKHRRTAGETLSHDTPLTDSFMAELIDSQRDGMLREALDSLPENWRRVMRMALDGVSNREIAARMGVTIDSVKAMKTRAMQRLREILPPELRPGEAEWP